MYNCEKCGEQVTEIFGSGRFCSRACANARNQTEDANAKRRVSNRVGYVKCSMTREQRVELIKKSSRYKTFQRERNQKIVHGFTCLELYNYAKVVVECEICGRTGIQVAVDHNHDTDVFRGILCSSCNAKLGWFEKERKNIERYLLYNNQNLANEKVKKVLADRQLEDVPSSWLSNRTFRKKKAG